jgi:hypothetical protein
MTKIEKQQAKEVALSKLTIEEQESLGLIKKPKKEKVKTNYKFKIDYMIGDSNGDTSKQCIISINNPFIKIITNALDKLDIIDGHWSIMLDDEHYLGNFKNGKITELEYDLLSLITGYGCDINKANEFLQKNGYEQSQQNLDYLDEFEGLLISETEYSWVSYYCYKLK